jgi:pyridoxine/pyridoxamine 5'-phosphate oxidase
VWASAVELWIEGADRVHDRARWLRALDETGAQDFTASPWHGTRLQP